MTLELIENDPEFDQSKTLFPDFVFNDHSNLDVDNSELMLDIDDDDPKELEF